MRITAKTRLLAVIGNPIEHSMSPVIHNAALKAAGLDYVYVAFRVEKIEEAVTAMRALGIRGFSVTIPHKETIIPHLDRLELSAEQTGSVNTVVNENGVLTGASTDGPGALAALERAGLSVTGKKILLIGTGGAARAIAFAAGNAGAGKIGFRYEIREQADRLVRDLEAAFPGRITLNAPLEEADILINASPVGMHPRVEDCPIDPASLSPEQVVFDIVYNPLRTRLLREAEARGCRTIEGVEMFAEQAILQFEMFTGKEAPRDLMRSTVRRALAQ
ncbi:MAG: shikimate dehydrogenase [Candidatus Hydrogenedentota bacterium]|nr:MAG: shikimate dehydrogenase [Candidatus Hydrogenedentota bacterium]